MFKERILSYESWLKRQELNLHLPCEHYISFIQGALPIKLRFNFGGLPHIKYFKKREGERRECIDFHLHTLILADGEGFEPSHDQKPSNALAGHPLKPLEYPSI